MVANQPIERPGSSDFLLNQLSALTQQADEQTRQSKFPFIVSHQNRTTLASVTDLAVVPLPNGLPGAAMLLYDGQGNLVLGTDATVGYGLDQPYVQVPMYSSTPGRIFKTETTFESLYTGQVQLYNSCFLGQWKMNDSWGNTGAASVVESYIKLANLVTGWTWQSPTVTSGSSLTTSPGILTVCGPFGVQLGANQVGNSFSVDIFSRVVSGGASSAIAVTPIFMQGCGYSAAEAYFAGIASS